MRVSKSCMQDLVDSYKMKKFIGQKNNGGEAFQNEETMKWEKAQRKRYLQNMKSHSLAGMYVWGRKIVESEKNIWRKILKVLTNP